MPDDITRRWRELAERRRIHFVELYDSGRWKRYYNESEFVAQMHEVVAQSDAWTRLSGSEPAQIAAE